MNADCLMSTPHTWNALKMHFGFFAVNTNNARKWKQFNLVSGTVYFFFVKTVKLNSLSLFMTRLLRVRYSDGNLEICMYNRKPHFFKISLTVFAYI